MRGHVDCCVIGLVGPDEAAINLGLQRDKTVLFARARIISEEEHEPLEDGLREMVQKLILHELQRIEGGP